ncbi:MAG: hypothetical protein IT284_02400 [Bacteroidetes bacterium]|nr:hypothetical protein [Bacteroidota bacterium]
MTKLIIKAVIGVAIGIIFGIVILKFFPGPGRHIDFLAITLTATNIVFALSNVKEMKTLFTGFGLGGCWLLVYGMGSINNPIGGTLVIVSALSFIASLIFSIAKVPSR